MQIVKKIPSRIFQVSRKPNLSLEHLYDVHIKNNNKIAVESEFLDLVVENKIWGLKINFFSKYNGHICLCGQNWKKVHLLTFVEKKRRHFENYVKEFGLKKFSSCKLLKNNNKIKSYKKINLVSDQQVTFFSKNQYEYDFVSKDWGSYLVPSFFTRLKMFNLIPFFSLKDCEIYLVFSNKVLKFQRVFFYKNKGIFYPLPNKVLRFINISTF